MWVGPIKITSGVRCVNHNNAIGGVITSAHVPFDLDDGEGEVGHAVDISVTSSGQRFKVIDTARSAGFRRIGDGNGFVHLDSDTRKPQDVFFNYYKSKHIA